MSFSTTSPRAPTRALAFTRYDQRTANSVDASVVHDERARLAFLAVTGRVLASSLDYWSTLTTAAGIALPHFGTWCIVDVVDTAGVISRVSVLHPDPVKQQAARDYYAAHPPHRDDAIGAARVIRTSESAFVLVTASDAIEEGALGADRDPLGAQGPRSLLIVPMRARGRILGAITFVTDGHRQYDAAHLLLAEDLGHRCAIAIDNARLHGEAEAAREHAAYAVQRADALRGAAESAREEADAANKARASFLTRIAHEFRTPLGVVLGHVGLLTDGIVGPVNGGQRVQLRCVEMATTHLLALIEEIVKLSPVVPGYDEVRWEELDLSSLLNEACALVAPLARAKGLELVLDVPDAPILLATDPTKFRQIVFNLASSAVTNTKAGAIRLCLVGHHDEVLLRVTDTRAGSSPADAEDLLGTFWQSHANEAPAGGTVLGLAMTRQLAQLLGGDVTLESSDAQGSTVLVRLPRDRRRFPALRHAATRQRNASCPAPITIATA